MRCIIRKRLLSKAFVAIIAFTALSSCSLMENLFQSKIELTDFERKIAQKIMLDIRTYCGSQRRTKYCKRPVTELPVEIAELITETDLGGVALFANNIESTEQILLLTNQIHQAALKSNNPLPIFIGIDQEGGRVVRLPRDTATSFSGNMAIGATYESHGKEYAKKVGRIIGAELASLGINVNFAPNIDVNVNPDNPVINVRSFGKDPLRVADLGLAMMDGFQKEGVIATLKHFPGHGNTNVDSHTGLPRIDYGEKTLQEIDILPFQKAIESSNPGMVMTAHIQYPNVDPSELTGINGERVVKPATMSYKFLTEILREQMGFKGVVLTDAMDMAGISHYFSMVNATIEAFYAGADMSVMPYKIRYKEDIEGFKRFVQQVAKGVQERGEIARVVDQSIDRINQLKLDYSASHIFDQTLAEQVKQANRILASKRSKAIEKALAESAVTQLKNEANALPIHSTHDYHIHVVIDTQEQMTIIENSLNDYWSKNNSSELTISYSLLDSFNGKKSKALIDKADALLAIYYSSRTSAVDLGGIDDLLDGDFDMSLSDNDKQELIKRLLSDAKRAGKKSVLVAMQSPYDIRNLMDDAQGVIVAYDANWYVSCPDEQPHGVSYDAVAALVLGEIEPMGKLPVSL